VKVNISTEGTKELQKEIERMSKRQVAESKREVYASGIDIQRKAKEKLRGHKAWDQGNLANSIMVDLIKSGAIAEIGPEAPYGPYVEGGTKPHFPPPDALEGWARRHGFDSAWPICKAIAKRGLKARPYLYPAYLEIEPKFHENLLRILRK